MLGLKDLLAVLERWDTWKRMRETPDRLDAMERRVAVIEEKLDGPWPPDICKVCGERALRLMRSVAKTTGNTVQYWGCERCRETEQRAIKPR